MTFRRSTPAVLGLVALGLSGCSCPSMQRPTALSAACGARHAITTCAGRQTEANTPQVEILEAGRARMVVSTPADRKRREDYLRANPDTSARIAQRISDGEIEIGMTVNEVEASWGTEAAVPVYYTSDGPVESAYHLPLPDNLIDLAYGMSYDEWGLYFGGVELRYMPLRQEHDFRAARLHDVKASSWSPPPRTPAAFDRQLGR